MITEEEKIEIDTIMNKVGELIIIDNS